MNIDRFLGSKTKADILKFLFFVRQGVSLRALENELGWSFPAIKKQVDILSDCRVINIEKSNNSWEIYLNDDFVPIISNMLLKYLHDDLKDLFEKKYKTFIYKYIYGKLFGNSIKTDLVIIHNIKDEIIINNLKKDIDNILKSWYIKVLNITFFTKSEFENRYRLGDKFVLQLVNLVD